MSLLQASNISMGEKGKSGNAQAQMQMMGKRMDMMQMMMDQQGDDDASQAR